MYYIFFGDHDDPMPEFYTTAKSKRMAQFLISEDVKELRRQFPDETWRTSDYFITKRVK